MDKNGLKKIQVKEALAKLMANENIVVEHAQVATASFDLVNRKLTIPNWQNISEDVYTLLISHEVGHALFTPQKQWADTIKAEKHPGYKNVVNIVEDVRIEKMIQQKYPGTARSFRAGYKELNDADLFGAKDQDISQFNILDRINLHFKIGRFGIVKVPFKKHEQKYVAAVETCKTFDDVLRVSKELLKHAQSAAKRPKEVPNSEHEKTASEHEKTTSEHEKTTSEHEKTTSEHEKTASEHKDDEIKSQTQAAFDQAMREQANMDQKLLYLTMPKHDLTKVIVPHKKILAGFRDYYKSRGIEQSSADISAFRENNKHVVNQLVSLFEMKKRAKADARTLIAKTGTLDTNKLHSYRYSEDIFRKVTITPNGKNHGLVMVFDMSFSMEKSMPGVLSQIVNLVMFCRKLNMPFEVYGFSDGLCSKEQIGDVVPVSTGRKQEVVLSTYFTLRNYFSSKMTIAEYNEMLGYVVDMIRGLDRPRADMLGATPLNNAILCLMQIVPEFKARHRLDIVNTILLTDGVDNSNMQYVGDRPDTIETSSLYNYVYAPHDIYLRHYASKNVWHLTARDQNKPLGYRPLKTSSETVTTNLLKMYRDITQTQIIGFYVSSESRARKMISARCDTQNDWHTQLAAWKTDRFAELKECGYNKYYIVPIGDELMAKGKPLELNGKMLSSIQRSFIKAMKAKRASRVMLTKFIENIA